MKTKTNPMGTRIPQNSRSQLPSRIVKAKLQMTMGATNATSHGVKKNENQVPAVSKALGKLATAAFQETMSLTKPVTSATLKQNNASKPAPVRQPLVTRSRTGIDLNNKTIGKAVPPRVAVNGAKKPAATSTAESKTPGNKTGAKRIPAYDYKARFLDLQERHQALKTKYDEAREQLNCFDDMPEQFENTKQELQAAQDEIVNLNQKNTELSEERDSLDTKNNALVAHVNDLQQRLGVLEEKCPKLEQQVEMLTKERDELKKTNVELMDKNEKLLRNEKEYQDQLFRSNIERKELHNTIMDLRGNIRVFCRVRPPLDSEIERPLCSWNYLDESSLELVNVDNKNKLTKNEFSFDHIFHQNSSQEDIFSNVSPLIQSALDGYNVCIFAYGQTGSGKTFTMDGGDGEDQLGVIPRTVDLLFSAIRDYKRLGWDYEISVQFLEIYNEVLYDLLSNDFKELDIRMVSATNKTDVYVSNLTEELVANENELRRFMHVAKYNRMTAATAGNERSSRSHAVTKIKLTGMHATKGEVCVGNINLVDLAGSESPKLSTRMDETKSINRSLSELSNVILALVQKQDHVPYRNSKLTHLLMPSLGGNSKTLMFVNVAPFSDCHQESVKSLRFASTVNSCKLQKAKKNKVLNQM